ncbi:DUF935 domain-containing protein [Xanthomonas campestris pv. raphani]|uniref:DUF935 domain-containing protein n=1 Tax=Xanthomonas campestris TaxID=339 RepID=UPI002B230E77|nr:DUF935 domain-containing protein [Xanthomonas campestris]MEA9746613.1 DUF935 domain-containing protein [Xanthomonas campestris pv. raphani]MEA9846591.1 DUF935 domain-containing protein [Xanthomonas campestris pv. raphani]MEA9927483.1 DUF935 domain-containing protein [Xanthomonas campestris pv. raphani]
MVSTSRILGPDGQPIQLRDLDEPQTSRVGHLHQEFQGHPARGLTPSKLNSILLAAEQGDVIAQYELFEDMEERDGHILSEMSKRRRAVSGLAWEIEPPANPTTAEKRNAVELQALIGSIDDFEAMLFDTTDAIGKGFVSQEIEWQRLGSSWVPKSIEHRPQSWFRLHRGYRQQIRLRDNSPDGAELIPFGWITHTHKARSGYVERASLFRALVWPYLFKNYSVGDLAEFLEIYGIPMRVGKYPPGASEKEKATLLRALVQIGHNAAGIIPDGMTLDFPTVADGDPKAFELMMDWCERTESKVILGATLTSQADRGSNTNALGNVHNEVRKELKDSDAKQVAATLSRDLVYPIAVLNGLAPDGYLRCPRLKLDIAESKDITVFAEALPKLVGMGMRINRGWAHTELGIPQAEANDKDVLVPLQEAAPPTPQPSKVAAATAAVARPIAAAADREDQLTVLLQRQADPAIKDMVDQVKALVDASDSLDALLAGLSQLQTTMSVDALTAAMGEALAVAGIAGMSDAWDDADG